MKAFKDKPRAVNAIIFSVLPAERQVRATIRVSQTNLEKSLSSRVDIQMDQNGCFLQASMLEAFYNFREDFQESLQKQREVDQTHKTNAPSKIWTNPRDPVVLSSQWRWSLPQISASTRILVAS